MRHFLLLVFLSVALLTPNNAKAYTPARPVYTSESSDLLYSQGEVPGWFDQWAWEHSEFITRQGKIGVGVGAVGVAAGAAMFWQTMVSVKEDFFNEDSNAGDAIIGTFVASTLGLLGLGTAIVGGIEILVSIPSYTWGAHLDRQPDLSTFNISEEYVGWRGIVDLRLAIAPSADIVYGYNYKDVFVGAGVGYSREFDNFEDFGIPAYLNLRWSISRSRISPFVGGKIGVDFYNKTPYWEVDYGTRVRCKNSYNSWWFSLNVSTFSVEEVIGIRIARSF